MVAGAGFEPATSGLSLRARLRCPKISSGFRFSSIFSTAALRFTRSFRHRRRSFAHLGELRSSSSYLNGKDLYLSRINQKNEPLIVIRFLIWCNPQKIIWLSDSYSRKKVVGKRRVKNRARYERMFFTRECSRAFLRKRRRNRSNEKSHPIWVGLQSRSFLRRGCGSRI